MMKKLLAALLETVHVATVAVLFTMTAWIASIPAPVRAWKGSGLAATRSEAVAGELQQYLLGHGPWLAAIVMVTVALGTFLRGDAKKILSGLRLVSAGAILLFSLWAFMGLPKDRYALAWNCLFVATSSDIVLTAALVGGGKGGGKAAAGGEEKKK